ncbi:MAG: response regulator [Thermoflexales bacterium]|nr:response regulator [Thermoflexales bacterium]
MTSSKSTILIVDDDDDAREMVAVLLRQAKYTLIPASSGQEALDIARQLAPDLILLDVMMPGMSGFEVCRHIRTDPLLAHVPVILVTALGDRQSRLQGLEAGADDFITKPFDGAELRARVSTVTRLNRYRQLLAERARFERLVELSPEGILILGASGAIELANPAMLALAGAANETELAGRKLHELIAAEQREAYSTFIASVYSGAVHSGASMQIESTLARLDGRFVPVELVAGYLAWGEKEDVQLIVRDITERKHAEERIQASLAEKDELLKEIHDRVKNNLQIIVSLLRLQADHTHDAQVIDTLRNTTHRVQSMALAHEQLYQSQDMARIDLAEYVQSLTAGLLYSQSTDVSAITVNVEGSDVFLGIGPAVPCGLILNELISNSLRHAFPKSDRETDRERQKKVEVKLWQAGEEVCMVVSDNGIGLPAELDFRNTQSLGLQLVILLTEQLDGQIQLDHRGGTSFTITFPR